MGVRERRLEKEGGGDMGEKKEKGEKKERGVKEEISVSDTAAFEGTT